MSMFSTLLVAAAVFGICFAVDKGFSKCFRSKTQHQSGMAVRVNKRNGVFGVGLSVIGVLAICLGITSGIALLLGGVIVLLMGIGLSMYYLTHGIFYDGESFLLSSFGKKERSYRYSQIREQKLYLIQGGSILIELCIEFVDLFGDAVYSLLGFLDLGIKLVPSLVSLFDLLLDVSCEV